jgi:hypothetical protein
MSLRSLACRDLSALVSLALVSLGAAAGLTAVACSGDPDGATAERDAGVDLDRDAGWETPAASGDKPLVDGGYAVGEAGAVVRADRFATQVVRFAPGPCAGFGAASMPGIALGPPEGAGSLMGSLDVVSLGTGGEIVLGFGANAIVDGPGPDFLVFENAFYANGDPTQIAADLGEVSVSADGETWVTFACTPGAAPPFGACAGWHPVYASTKNGISPFDPEAAGGDAYDLAAVGLREARFVRIRDMFRTACPDKAPRPTNYGFDLDAIAVVNARLR